MFGIIQRSKFIVWKITIVVRIERYGSLLWASNTAGMEEMECIPNFRAVGSLIVSRVVSSYGLDDRAIEVRSPPEAKGFFL
jgi:hypothetical protein